jgi:hypothetical protein
MFIGLLSTQFIQFIQALYQTVQGKPFDRLRLPLISASFWARNQCLPLFSIFSCYFPEKMAERQNPKIENGIGKWRKKKWPHLSVRPFFLGSGGATKFEPL